MPPDVLADLTAPGIATGALWMFWRATLRGVAAYESRTAALREAITTARRAAEAHESLGEATGKLARSLDAVATSEPVAKLNGASAP